MERVVLLVAVVMAGFLVACDGCGESTGQGTGVKAAGGKLSAEEKAERRAKRKAEKAAKRAKRKAEKGAGAAKAGEDGEEDEPGGTSSKSVPGLDCKALLTAADVEQVCGTGPLRFAEAKAEAACSYRFSPENGKGRVVLAEVRHWSQERKAASSFAKHAKQHGSSEAYRKHEGLGTYAHSYLASREGKSASMALVEVVEGHYLLRVRSPQKGKEGKARCDVAQLPELVKRMLQRLPKPQ